MQGDVQGAARARFLFFWSLTRFSKHRGSVLGMTHNEVSGLVVDAALRSALQGIERGESLRFDRSISLHWELHLVGGGFFLPSSRPTSRQR